MNVCTCCECVDNFYVGDIIIIVNVSLIKSCSFFGHSEITITNELIDKITIIIEKLIVNENFGIFYFGGFGMFDDLCYTIVSKLKEKYTDIKRIFCLYDPRHTQKSKRPEWLKKEIYEEYIYFDLQYDYYYTRIYYRNCEIINRSDYVICYVANKNNSGANKALKYIKKNKKPYINLVEYI